MSGRTRLAVAALVLLAVLLAEVLVVFAASACAVELPGQPCPQAGANRAAVIALLGISTGALVAALAFVAEFALRRRIVYRGAWGRATRRGLLAGLALASLAGLRLGGAATVPSALFVLTTLAIVEWFAMRHFDVR